jgi:hypothetical protein
MDLYFSLVAYLIIDLANICLPKIALLILGLLMIYLE